MNGQKRNALTNVLVVSIAGILAAIVGYVAIDGIGTTYPTPPEVLSLGATPTAEERAAAHAAQLSADCGNGMVWLGTVGAILGGLLALAAGWLRSAGRRSIIGVVAGCLFGAGLGCLAAKFAVSYHDSLIATMLGGRSDKPEFMMMHGLTWGLVGLGVGLVCGVSAPEINMKSISISTIVGAIAGVLAGVSFPFAVAIGAPLVDSSLPIPQPGTARMIWIGLGALFISIGVGRTID